MADPPTSSAMATASSGSASSDSTSTTPSGSTESQSTPATSTVATTSFVTSTVSTTITATEVSTTTTTATATHTEFPMTSSSLLIDSTITIVGSPILTVIRTVAESTATETITASTSGLDAINATSESGTITTWKWMVGAAAGGSAIVTLAIVALVLWILRRRRRRRPATPLPDWPEKRPPPMMSMYVGSGAPRLMTPSPLGRITPMWSQFPAPPKRWGNSTSALSNAGSEDDTELDRTVVGSLPPQRPPSQHTLRSMPSDLWKPAFAYIPPEPQMILSGPFHADDSSSVNEHLSNDSHGTLQLRGDDPERYKALTVRYGQAL